MADVTGLPDYLCDNCGAVNPEAGMVECQSCEIEVLKDKLDAAERGESQSGGDWSGSWKEHVAALEEECEELQAKCDDWEEKALKAQSVTSMDVNALQRELQSARAERDALLEKLRTIIGIANNDSPPPQDEWAIDDAVEAVKELRAENAKLREELAATLKRTVPNNCSICGEPITGSVIEYGGHYAHPRCFNIKGELNDWKKTIEELTPGGSEFHNDPNRCAEFIKTKNRNLMEVLLETKRKLTAEQEK